MAQNEIVLFDLPSRPPCKSWSLNPWKTRFILNYKNIPYHTEWLEYPDIEARLSPHLPPKPPPDTPYTIPTILLPSGSYLMDSKVIAAHLESLYPSPSLHLSSAFQSKIEALMPKVMTTLAPIYILLIPANLLNEVSVPYWNKSRAEWVGMDLDTLAEKHGGEKAWEKFTPVVQEVTALLKENADGPYFLGKEVSYADFVWGGFLICCKRIAEREIYEEVLERSGDRGVHEALLKGVGKWAVRDD
ncbi:hypothetical protein QBC35DRAFT_143982 [Podospora australis]|uniref:GST N-terminal domain-containing protein n=1 Tax=Podospora australis TaxID=1536484 RepID=A0AAN7AEB8_9PEZI|nr:hypothetical protein QBC35DRAFT_143982 [Podospora australis]